MKPVIIIAIAFVLLMPSVFAESQTLPTSKGTLDVKLTQGVIKPNIQTKINIDFINPQTQKIQEHIDYTISVSKEGERIFGPIPLTHTSVGSIKIPIEFNLGEGIYIMDFEIEGILFQPIPPETVSFDIQVGDASTSFQIPSWIKNNVKWWADGSIDDNAFISGIEFLILEKIIEVPITQKTASTTNEIPSWVRTNAEWWADGEISDSDFVKAMEYLVNNGIIQVKQPTQSQIDPPSLELDAGPSDDFIDTQYGLCSGDARCITGFVTKVIDGDTIKIDGQSIRFAMASSPELDEEGGNAAKKFIEVLCPVGSIATVDEDDKQTQGSYGRILGVIHCNGVNLNKELVESKYGYLITDFCDSSEFVNEEWAQKHGCDSKSEFTTSKTTENNCDSSYPDVCIAPYPPDLDCGDIPYTDFRVLRPDQHGFDGDYDGIGCESYSPPSTTESTSTQSDCDPSYPDFCIPSSPPDLDCGDIPQKRFTVLQPDPHRFDGDKDGIGCES